VTQPVAVVGRGRLGTALARALARTRPVRGPLGRDVTSAQFAGAAAVVLCVPDRALAQAAATLPVEPGTLVGHCSGALGLEVLAPHAAFSLHPLMTFTGAEDAASFAGAHAAVAGTSERALDLARCLAAELSMTPVVVAGGDRALYHAAASIACNYLVTLQETAAALAAHAQVPREAFLPLVRRTIENWAEQGPEALTGPVARGDEETVARQRAAVGERAPELLELYDALTEATRALARAPAPGAAR
jgi:predicted short-subunit dehydrogenase-like oxidoreductase (DUF2520 family)